MKIKTFVNGYLEENCYLIYKDNFGLIIDPGNVIAQLDEFIKESNIKVLGILITHYHNDHTGALDYYKKLYSANVIDYTSENIANIKPFNFEIIETFGHTKDSISFYFEKDNIMFTGDFLFKETIGNYEDKNEYLMNESLNTIIKYDDNIKIYPGHGEESTIKHEKENNPYIRGLSC